MAADRREPLAGRVAVLATDDVKHRQRQQALRRLLERGIEDLLDLVPKQYSGRPCGADPYRKHDGAQREQEPSLQAARQPHALASR